MIARWACVLVAACGFTVRPSSGVDDAAVEDDGAIDGRHADSGSGDGGGSSIDAPSCTTFSSQTNTCNVTFGPSITITSDKVYNTTTHTISDPNGANPMMPAHQIITGPAGEVDVLLAASFTINSGVSLRAIGSRPFGVIASGSVTITGALDANSYAASSAFPGAGSRSAIACGAVAGMNGTGDTLGGAGGGGGALRGAGGRGGTADLNNSPTLGGLGGTALPSPPLGPLGGCPGGAGGNSGSAPGGSGGGAIYIATPGTLTVMGVIRAGGSGGRGGSPVDGGGGAGGSGGMIFIEAGQSTGAGALAANGGSGGGGTSTGGNGGTGGDGLASAMQAMAGAPHGAGGPGGAGAAGAILVGASPAGANAGGGGAGGGAGFIIIRGTNQLTGTVSPSAQ